jgi:DivIVA domain-containing protein
MSVHFSVVLRGYDREQVDAVSARAMRAIEGGTAAERSEIAAELTSSHFRMVMRGYMPEQVDAHVTMLLQELRPD